MLWKLLLKLARTLFQLVEIRRNAILKSNITLTGAQILELSFCLWKALLKLGGIQYFKKFLLVEN